MASKVEALVRNFLKTDGEALYLVPGEKIFLIKGANKLVVGRENLSDESFRAVAAELVPGAPPESLSAVRHRVPFRVDEATEPVEIQFGRSGNAHAIMICRLRAPEPAPEPEPQPMPERRPDPPPRPAAAPRPATGSYGVPAAAPRPAAEVVPLDVPEALSSRDFDASSISRLGASRRPERAIDEALRRLVERRGSDLLLVSGAPPAFRAGGELSVAEELPPAGEELEKSLTTLLTERARRDLEARGSARFSFDHPEAGRLLVRVVRDKGGLSAQLKRVLAAPPPVEELGLPPAALRLRSFETGLVVVAGAPGSGKTTTRAALLAHALAERPRAAVVVEDPLEVPVPRARGTVSLRELGQHAPTLSDAVRASIGVELLALPAPDAAETLGLTLEAASAGLVYLEVTAGDVAEALERLFELLPEPRLERTRWRVAALLRGVLVHHVVPLAAGGRAAVFDLLLNSAIVANVIRDGKTFQLPALLGAGRQQGMADANAALAELVKRRAVTLPAALAASGDPGALRTLLGAAAPEGAPAPENSPG